MGETATFITTAYATDLLGGLLMAALLLSGGWRLQARRQESRIMLALIVAALVGCVLDPIAWLVDGMPGAWGRVLVYAANTLLFLLNVVIGPAYIMIVSLHIREEASKWRKRLIYALCFTEMAFLLANLFLPLVFDTDAANRYRRQGFFWVFIAVELALVLYGLALYFLALRRGKFLRFFPAWLFFLPLAIGVIVQSLCYGVSLIWPSIGVSTCALIICMQNESIYLDKLTGVYNRYYLDEVSETLRRGRKGCFAALMLDMNGFKEINDNYSHAEGDVALVAMANILTETVGAAGTVVRFAGDEFVVLLDHPTLGIVEEYRARILAAIDAYNAGSDKPYRLAAAIGGRVFDARKEDISDFLTIIDHSMYEEKNAYYRTRDRRRRPEGAEPK